MKLFRFFILVFFATALIACGGAEERKAVYMEKAKVSMEAGDLDKARVELKNVLQIDPKDSDAYFFLGKVYEQQKEYRKAFSHYLKVEKLNPDHLESQAKLGRFYLLLANDIDKAQEKMNLVLLKEPDNIEGLLLKAAIFLKKGNKSEAINIAQVVLSKDPGSIEGVSFLASLYFSDEKIDMAIAVLNKGLEVDKDNERLSRMLASIYISIKDYEKAKNIYKKLIEKNPDSSSNYNSLASLYNQTNDTSKAIGLLRESIEKNPEDADRYLTLIKYINEVNGSEEAIKELKKFIKKDSGFGKLRLALGELYLLSGDKKSAIDVYKNLISDYPEEVSGISASVALAIIYLRDNDYVRASEIIENAIATSPGNPKVNFLRAKIAIHNKDVETAIISLRLVIKGTPENIEAYLLLSHVYGLEKNNEQARAILNTAYENNKTNHEALLKLVKFYRTRDIEQADKIIDNYNKLRDLDYEGLSIKAEILNQKKAHSEAFVVAKRLMDEFPEKPSGYLQVIPYYVQQGDTGKAVLTLEQGYVSTKDNRKILIVLTTLQVAEKKFDIVEKRIKAELSSKPDDDGLKLLLSKVYIFSKNFDAAEFLLKEVVEGSKDTEEPYLILAEIYRNKNDNNSAKLILNQGADNIPKSLKIPLKLAGIYELDEEYKKSIEVYRRLYQLSPDNLVITNNLASMLSEHSDNKDDLELAKTLIEKLISKEQPVFYDTIGWVYYKLGDYQSAIKYLTQIVEKAPKINVFNYHLGMAYKMSGDKAQAKIYLEESLADGKEFKEKDLAKAALKDL